MKVARADRLPAKLEDLLMSQTVAAQMPAAVDYEKTLVLAIEVSNKSWVLAAQVPGLPHAKAKRTIDPEAEALLTAIAGYRARAAAMGRSIERVIAVYEAGWSGFWLARWLIRHGVEVHVVQPSSVPVDRRIRRAKSDGIDSELLLRTLLAWLRGEPRGCSMVPVPDEADEDARRCVRERTELISERVGLTNRIGAVLATLGVSDYNPLLGTEVVVWPNCGLLSASHSLQTRMPRSNVCSFGWNWC
jgi:transposase